MTASDIAPTPGRSRVVLLAATVGVVLVAVGALVAVRLAGDPSTEAVAPASTAAVTATTAPPSTTVSTTTSTTTLAPTTTLARQMSLPVPPPPDPRGPESNPPLGRIAIPAIGVDAELEQGIRLTTLDRGPGHWPGSALPGQIGNVVVAGHRTSKGAEFRHLDRLVPGDEVVFTTDVGTHTYVVTGTQIVGPDALWITDPTDTPTATLFACHPVGSTRERIVVNLALSS